MILRCHIFTYTLMKWCIQNRAISYEKNSELYKCIVTLMGGFRQLRVRVRLIYKLFNCIGTKDSCADAGIIAPGSAAQAVEGRHYYRCMRLHKECFNSLVQFHFEKVKD